MATATEEVTPVSEWSDNPQVPALTPSPGANMSSAIQVVKAFVQVLANWSQWLKDQLTALTATVSALGTTVSGKANLAGGNTFTGVQNIGANVNITGGGNTLAVTGNITTGGDLTVGDDLVVTDNLTMNGNSFSVPNASITLGSGSLHITSGSADVGGNISTTGGDIILPAAKRVKYATPVAFLKRVRISCGTTPQPASSVAFDGTKWTTVSTAYTISIPIPQYSNFTEITAVWLRYEASGANGTVELIRHEINDWLFTPSGATPTLTSLGDTPLTTTGSGVKTAVITLGSPEVMANGSYDYFIKITGSASSSHVIHGAALTVKLYSPGID